MDQSCVPASSDSEWITGWSCPERIAALWGCATSFAHVWLHTVKLMLGVFGGGYLELNYDKYCIVDNIISTCCTFSLQAFDWWKSWWNPSTCSEIAFHEWTHGTQALELWRAQSCGKFEMGKMRFYCMSNRDFRSCSFRIACNINRSLSLAGRRTSRPSKHSRKSAVGPAASAIAAAVASGASGTTHPNLYLFSLMLLCKPHMVLKTDIRKPFKS